MEEEGGGVVALVVLIVATFGVTRLTLQTQFWLVGVADRNEPLTCPNVKNLVKKGTETQATNKNKK